MRVAGSHSRCLARQSLRSADVRPLRSCPTPVCARVGVYLQYCVGLGFLGDNTYLWCSPTPVRARVGVYSQYCVDRWFPGDDFHIRCSPTPVCARVGVYLLYRVALLL